MISTNAPTHQGQTIETPRFDASLKPLFLVWGFPHGSHRSQFMAQALGMQVEHISLTARQGWWQALFKYPVQSFQSLLLLMRRRPQVVFVQNPPVFAALVVYFYALFSKAGWVIDSHTDALLAPWWTWSLPLHRFLSRRAVTTLVTNDYLHQMVSNWSASAFVLADPPVTFPHRRAVTLDPSRFHVVLVSSASPDEPVGEVLKAAKMLPEVIFHITGNAANHQLNLKQTAPPNVHFTGFLPDEAFYGLLEAAQVVMCLTTENHTIQSGASEALWLGQPIITSNWSILQNYFSKGTLYVDNTASSICEAVSLMQQRLFHFQAEIVELQQERRWEWHERAGRLVQMIEAVPVERK